MAVVTWQVNELKASLGETKGEVDRLKRQLTAKDGEIVELKSTVERLQGQLHAFEESHHATDEYKAMSKEMMTLREYMSGRAEQSQWLAVRLCVSLCVWLGTMQYIVVA